MLSGLGVSVHKFRNIWARVSNGGWVWIDQNDRAGIGNIFSGCVDVCVQV